MHVNVMMCCVRSGVGGARGERTDRSDAQGMSRRRRYILHTTLGTELNTVHIPIITQ